MNQFCSNCGREMNYGSSGVCGKCLIPDVPHFEPQHESLLRNEPYVQELQTTIRNLAYRVAELNNRLHLPERELEKYMDIEIEKAKP